MSEPTTKTMDNHDEEDADQALLAGRYRLQNSLGEGGMGQVYEAEHVLMKKMVAIKVLRPELTEDDEIVARFHREAQAAAALNHPNVCQATDFGQTDDGAFFLVMEHLEGDTLQETLNTYGQLTIKRALHVARQIATALQVAHEQGIVHRDLKPENVMLVDRRGDSDTVKIMDFGIARLLATAEEGDGDDAATRLTRQGMVYGTPHYMSPEQIAGDDVDAGTDIYALGVVLFEMLTGEPPYDADSIARVMGQHVTEPIPVLAERCPDSRFPASLERLLNRLMAKDRADRPETAAEVIDAIDAIDPDRDVVIDRPNRRDEATMSVEAVAPGSGPRPRRPNFWTRLSAKERFLVIGISAFFLFSSFSVATAGVLYVTFWDTGERQAQVVEDRRESLLEKQQIASAVDAARGGDRSELDALLEEQGDDPHLRYLSLEADLEAGRSIDLIEEASEIFSLDSRYAHEPSIVEPIVERFASGPDRDEAGELLAEYMSSTARSEVAELARLSSSRSTRNRAFELLEEEGELRHLEPWERATAEIRQTSGCSDLKEKIAEIVSLGDTRAIPTLEAYQAKSTRGCGRIGLSDCYGCIRGDLRDAVAALSED